MHATLVKASDYLTREQVRRLRGKSDFVGAVLVLHAWALIAGCMVLFAWWPNPFTFLVGVMVIGGRQLGLAILMHDAAHGLLFANRGLNDRVGGLALCLAGLHQPGTLPALPSEASPVHAAARGSGPGAFRGVSGQPQEPAAQDPA